MDVAGDDNVIIEAEPSRLEAYLLGRLADQRRHRRIVISLPVRFMASDESEHRGLLFDMSPGGVSVTADVKPPMGSRAVLYIDDIGRVEGEVCRHHLYGFGVRLNVTQSRRDKIAERLTFHANRHRLRDEDLREHERVESSQNSVCSMPDGTEVGCKVIDLSLTGAGIAIEPRPSVGSEIVIGRMHGRVVRHIPQGVAIRFLQAATSQAMTEARIRGR